LEFGWAYGDGGSRLRGKDCWLTITTGAGEEKYLQGGEHGQSMSTFLLPIEQTAKLCGLRWHAPYIVYGARQLDQQSADAHATFYRDRLTNYPDWQHSTHDTSLPISPSSHS
jgi:glutathione-regulated potassium-efflux system ancillary protein KefF